MGVIKKASYMVDNGTDYDELHFTTDAAQVEYEHKDGSKGNLQQALGGCSIKVVDALPANQDANTIYLIKES